MPVLAQSSAVELGQRYTAYFFSGRDAVIWTADGESIERGEPVQGQLVAPQAESLSRGGSGR